MDDTLVLARAQFGLNIAFHILFPTIPIALGWARWGVLWVALGVALVSLATPFASETVRHKWFDFPRTLWLMLLPLASAGAWLWIWRATRQLERGESRADTYDH